MALWRSEGILTSCVTLHHNIRDRTRSTLSGHGARHPPKKQNSTIFPTTKNI